MKVSRLMTYNEKYFKSFPVVGIFFFIVVGRNGILLTKDRNNILFQVIFNLTMLIITFSWLRTIPAGVVGVICRRGKGDMNIPTAV